MKRYTMTKEQHERLLGACKPVTAIALHCEPISSPQANANAAWRELGDELGFDYMTVRAVPGQPETVFEAEPNVEA